MPFQLNDQVVHFKPNGYQNRLVRVGAIVRLDEVAGTATVNFPHLNRSEVLPLSELEKTSQMFGQVRVQPSPARRTLSKLL